MEKCINFCRHYNSDKTAYEFVCSATREYDSCSCEGDMTKCDFYEEVKKNAARKLSEESAKENTKHKPYAKDNITAAKQLIYIALGFLEKYGGTNES